MNYNIKGTGIDITDGVRTYVEKKLVALEKLLPRDSARVDIVVGNPAVAGEQFMAEITLHDAGAPLHAECFGSSLYEAIDTVTAEMVSELSKSKKKRLNNFRHSAVRVKEYLRGWRQNI